MMNYRYKTKDELIKELQNLQQEYEILKTSYEKDISELKQAEEALKESQYLYETLSRVSPVGIFRTDLNGYTTYVNPKWSELSGLSSDDAYGNGWLNAVHPEDRGKLFELWLNDFKSTKESSAEYRFVRPDGSIVWVMGNAVPEWVDNEIIGYIGTVTDITGLKQTEIALAESETKYRQLVTRSPDGIFIVDLSGKFISANRTICESLHCTDEEILSMKIWDIVPERFQSLHKQRLAAIMKGESPSASAEYEVKGKDGVLHVVEMLSVPYYKENEIIGFQGIARDITERKKAEDKLRSSEERLKLLFEYAPDAYYLYDFKGNLIDGNIACEKLLGYNKDELVGKNFLKLSLLSVGQLPKAASLLLQNSLGRSTGPVEFVLNRKDGSKVTVEIISHPVKMNDKTLVLSMARDISERRRAEKVIMESEERYRMIFENVQDVYYETSMEGKILDVSPSIAILSKGQYQREDILGKSMYDFYPDPVERTAFLSKLKEHGTVSDFEITLRNRDGSLVPCSVSAKICMDALGHPEKIIGSSHDITDRKNASDSLRLAKEKAESSDRLKTAFLNNISHEVRTPLNGILGFAEIIAHSELSEEVKEDSLSILKKSSDRLLNTITDYIDTSMLTSGNMSVHKKTFVPARLLRNKFDNYKKKCSDRKMELCLQIPEQSENLTVSSDPELFRKIFSHFMNNAIKFTEKGRITYGYNVRTDELEFFVKDTGIGIGQESIDTIFDSFVKGDRGPSILNQGSGLGLSIAKGMVDIIGGKIKVESEIGMGSCFSFSIPIIKEAKREWTGTSGNEYKEIIKGTTILVAEDDEANFLLIKYLLIREIEANVLHAWNGKEAIELFKVNPGIKLILMDIKMPEIDGLEATVQIKLLNKDIPVIGITAYAMSGDEDKVLAAGCDGYLSKPISKVSLMDKIAEFIIT